MKAVAPFWVRPQRSGWGGVRLEGSLAAGRKASLGQGPGMPDTCRMVSLASRTPTSASAQACLGRTIPRFPTHSQEGQALACTPLLCPQLGFTKTTHIPEGLIRFWKPRPPPTAYLRLDRRGASGAPPHAVGTDCQQIHPLQYARPCPFCTEPHNSTAVRNPKELPAPSFR